MKDLLNQSESQVQTLEEQKRSAEVNLARLTKVEDFLNQSGGNGLGETAAEYMVRIIFIIVYSGKRKQVTKPKTKQYLVSFPIVREALSAARRWSWGFLHNNSGHCKIRHIFCVYNIVTS